MKSFLTSIHPKWCAKIFNFEKTLEIRRTAPKDWVDYLSGKTKKKPEPMTGYIYCTKGMPFVMACTDIDGKPFYPTVEKCVYLDENTKASKHPELFLNGYIVANFTLRKVEEILALPTEIGCSYQTLTLPFKFLMKKSCVNSEGFNHYLKCKNGYAWHISDLEIFDEPKKLSEFYTLKCNQKKEPCTIKDVFGVEECHRLCKMCKSLTKAPQSFCYVEAAE